ncbi:MAG: replication-associated recombination protein A [Saprospiraceae bacterium]
MTPLAERVRPRTLKEFIGQSHLIGPSGMLSKLMSSGHIPSLILWGPPGVGKTTLANLIAEASGRNYYSLSAINSGVKDVRSTIEKAKNINLFNGPNPILFIDEIHRFSKSQQDSLLGAVEKGVITLIGATTENPSFEVISALLSRCQTLILNPHTKEDLQNILKNAIEKDEVLKLKKIDLKENNNLLRYSGGDARKLLNCLEIVINHLSEGNKKVIITDEKVSHALKSNPLIYNKDGDMHYDIISAFIKSIRGSDPNATLYYLARMIEGGEDPKFICRRMIIAASEDIGLANPNALLLANACFDTITKIGMPEGQIPMSQCAIYLATSEKSNASYSAMNRARAIVKETGNLPVPLQLRNAPTKLMKDLGYGSEYKYAHDYDSNFVKDNMLPDQIVRTSFYFPKDNKTEQGIANRMTALWGDYYKWKE